MWIRRFVKPPKYWWAAVAMAPVGLISAQESVRPQFETAQTVSSPQLLSPSQDQGFPAFSDENIANSSGDLGEQWVFQSKEKPRFLTGSADVSAFYTSNVALTSRDEEKDYYLVGQLAVSYQRPLTNDLAFDIGLQQAFYRYNEFTELNFDSLNIGAGLSWQIPGFGGVSSYLRYNFNRLTSENFGDELYTSHSFILGAQKVFQLSRADSLYLGASGQINSADPDSLERKEVAVYGGYVLSLTRSVVGDISYRAALYDYSDADRRDVTQTLSLTLSWRPAEYFAVTASISGALNRSDEATFDYDLLTGGLSLSARYQF